MSNNLRIGIPSKGRQAEINEGFLKAAGLSFRRSERMLFARCKEIPAEILFLRTDDIPTLCAEGAIDMALVGSDVVAEAEADVDTRLELGGGSWHVSVCVPDNSPIQHAKDLAGKRIATSFPNVTRQYLKQHQIDAHLVNLSGSMEIMISLGVAEAIVDLVETGSTLAANQLRVLDDIGSYQTIVIQNKQRRRGELVDRIIRRLQGVVVARSYSLLEYNVPRAKLKDAEKITPGFNSPTVSALEDPTWCAVKVMVKRGEVITIMEQLEAIGASAILETQIANCRL
jgi:ATP phosphoribosyltransferase